MYGGLEDADDEEDEDEEEVSMTKLLISSCSGDKGIHLGNNHVLSAVVVRWTVISVNVSSHSAPGTSLSHQLVTSKRSRLSVTRRRSKKSVRVKRRKLTTPTVASACDLTSTRPPTCLREVFPAIVKP